MLFHFEIFILVFKTIKPYFLQYEEHVFSLKF